MIMRTVRWASWLGAVAVTVPLMAVRPAVADVASDRAAAIVAYPKIEVNSEWKHDTVIQLTNTSDEVVNVQCFYINANSHCTNSGEICHEADDCCAGGFCGVCAPGCNETDFRIRLTPRQPLGWLASEGLTDFPVDGRLRIGVGGSSNAGSRIPGVPEDPFQGELKCIVTDSTGTPIDSNVLTGRATVTDYRPATETDFDISTYNAPGIQAMAGKVNDDKVLVLGGPEAEYNGCPNILILNHFFDGVMDPAGNGDQIWTNLVLTPCGDDLLRQIPVATVVQYLVYNEFEQRFSTSRTVWCQQRLYLSEIDTSQEDRSIFFAGVAGTVTGQTRLSPLQGGLLGVAFEWHGDQSAAFNVHFQGDRSVADTITLP
jgi:hypothetical protein